MKQKTNWRIRRCDTLLRSKEQVARLIATKRCGSLRGVLVESHAERLTVEAEHPIHAWIYSIDIERAVVPIEGTE